ncbi:hypothetical protein ACS0TY_027641 [Phlomoides rotata]
MKQDLLTFLPPEIIIDVLSRLPVRTIKHCKCVRKSWLALIETHEFVKSHLSKSVPGLIIEDLNLKRYKLYEFEDGQEHEHLDLHNPLTKFKLPRNVFVCGSADGLLFLRGCRPISLYICNPINRDYIKLDVPKEFDNIKTTDQGTCAKPECHVYTLETGSWRTTAGPLLYGNKHPGTFLFGNLHWLELKLDGSPWVSCFDLEKEIFSTISCVRPLLGVPLFGSYSESFVRLVALGDCLCLCDNTSDNDIVIWLMKDYGVEKSWTKEFVISKIPAFIDNLKGVVYPIKVFKDGDILMAFDDALLLHYSKKDGTMQIFDMFLYNGGFNWFLHTPSFYSLKSFCKVNVRSF